MAFSDLQNQAEQKWSSWGSVTKRWVTFGAGCVVGVMVFLVLRAIFGH